MKIIKSENYKKQSQRNMNNYKTEGVIKDENNNDIYVNIVFTHIPSTTGNYFEPGNAEDWDIIRVTDENKRVLSNWEVDGYKDQLDDIILNFIIGINNPDPDEDYDSWAGNGY